MVILIIQNADSEEFSYGHFCSGRDSFRIFELVSTLIHSALNYIGLSNLINVLKPGL